LRGSEKLGGPPVATSRYLRGLKRSWRAERSWRFWKVFDIKKVKMIPEGSRYP
jgi:hypothetical protein